MHMAPAAALGEKSPARAFASFGSEASAKLEAVEEARALVTKSRV